MPARPAPHKRQPRRRRGPGPRASCPHLPTRRAALPGCAGVPPARRNPHKRRREDRAQPSQNRQRKRKPRRRRGPGPRASCPHLPAGRNAADEPRPTAWVRGRPARTSQPTQTPPRRPRAAKPKPPAQTKTPPKAGPGTAGILPAPSHAPRRRRQAAARFLGARASCPHLPARRNAAGKPRRASWVRGRPARTFPRAAMPPASRGALPGTAAPPPARLHPAHRWRRALALSRRRPLRTIRARAASIRIARRPPLPPRPPTVHTPRPPAHE